MQTSFIYDGAGRLRQQQDAAGIVQYDYDNKGRLYTVSENGASITRRYDALDRMTNYSDAFGNALQYAYDAAGNLTNLTYPGGKQVGYVYDAANRLTTVKDWDDRITSYFYDANNNATNIVHPNVTVTARAYNLDGRPWQQQDIAGGTNIIYQVNYLYDQAGQILGEFGQPSPATLQPTNGSMVYDADNELTSYAGQTVNSDSNGNMTLGPFTNGAFAVYTYDARNRLTVPLSMQPARPMFNPPQLSPPRKSTLESRSKQRSSTK